MFSLRICRYSLGNLPIEILKAVKKSKIYKKIKGYQRSPGSGNLTKNLPRVAGIRKSFQICPVIARGAVTCGIDWIAEGPCNCNAELTS